MSELPMPILQTHRTGEDYDYTNPVCTAGDWWVTSAIDVIFVMVLIGVGLWLVKQCLGIWNTLFRIKT